MTIEQYSHLYQTELLENVLPFWLQHSIDRDNGGFFTCLSTDGQVFDRDKFIWLQARQVWTFAMLYNQVEQRETWLNTAIHGAEFLSEYGRASNGNWYFSLAEDGRPLVQPYNIFSDCFAAMAFGQLFKASSKDSYAEIASQTFANILKRKHNPKGLYNKAVPDTRPLKNFTLPMILCNLCLELEHLLAPKLVNQTIEICIEEVMNQFYQPSIGLIVENINPDGSLSDTFDGRLLNPGHAIEAMWFVMDLGVRLNRPKLIHEATTIMLQTIEHGWDPLYGGIFYFMDLQGHPPQQLEWDQKLWWVHLETLIALLKGYQHTQNPACWEWFEKVHQYTWKRFPDPQHGEWFGYLNRQGEILLNLKGGKWKGCFHVPRGLYQCWTALRKIQEL